MKSGLVTAIYCRTAQYSDYGIENQEAMLRKYAADNSHSNIAVYADNAYSGVSLDRPAFRRLQADVNAGLVGLVLVKDMARISRKFIQVSKFFDEMQNKDVAVISVMDGFDLNERTAEIKAMRKALNKFYSKTRRRKKAV